MNPDSSLKNIAKVMIFAILCSEMHTSFVNESSTVSAQQRRIENKRDDGTLSAVSVAYQASVRLKAEDLNTFGDGHICSGALIAPSVVLTSAQCTFTGSQAKRHPSELRVVLGAPNRFVRHADSLVYDVTHIYRAPQLEGETLSGDVAILMLEKDVPQDHRAVKPIQWTDSHEHIKHASIQYELTSWGVTLDKLAMSHLMQLNGSVGDPNECQHMPASRSDLMCLNLSEERRHIELDIGAPVVHNDVLVGLVSHVEPDSVVLFTNLQQYGRWIREQIGDGTNKNGSMWGSLLFFLLTLWSLHQTKYAKKFY